MHLYSRAIRLCGVSILLLLLIGGSISIPWSRLITAVTELWPTETVMGADETIHRSLEVGTSPVIIVDNPHGSITVSVWESRCVEMIATKSGYDKTSAGARKRLKNTNVLISHKRIGEIDMIHIVGSVKEEDRAGLHDTSITISVPPDSDLTLNADYGRVIVKGSVVELRVRDRFSVRNAREEKGK